MTTPPSLSHPGAEIHVPDSSPIPEALFRTTCLGIGAHPDDLEFMAPHGILACFQRTDAWFGGVTCTDGAGSARTGPYENFTDAEMIRLRAEEQRTAARIGQYGFVAQLGHPSKVAKNATLRSALVNDLEGLLRATRPEVLYTHHGMDKHAAHIGVFLAVLEAARRLEPAERPRRVLGCEVWRSLDWIPDDEKVVLDLTPHPNLAASLNGVFDSQITGGKRYDLAVEGRRRANATFGDPLSIDSMERAAYAVDLTPLFADDKVRPEDFFAGFVERLGTTIRGDLRTAQGV